MVRGARSSDVAHVLQGREHVAVRSIHFRVSDEMYILIQQGAEEVGASVAHFELMEKHDAKARADAARRTRPGPDAAPAP